MRRDKLYRFGLAGLLLVGGAVLFGWQLRARMGVGVGALRVSAVVLVDAEVEQVSAARQLREWLTKSRRNPYAWATMDVAYAYDVGGVRYEAWEEVEIFTARLAAWEDLEREHVAGATLDAWYVDGKPGVSGLSVEAMNRANSSIALMVVGGMMVVLGVAVLFLPES